MIAESTSQDSKEVKEGVENVRQESLAGGQET
jgi:hypothetical protein